MKFLNLSLLAALASAAPTKRQTTSAPSDLFSFFVFGDSYTASGFNASSPSPSIAQPLGFPPIGPYPDDLLGNPLVANQSTANGPNWVEFLTAKFNTTTTLGYDFAISGASIPDGFSDEILNIYEPRFASLYSKDGSSGKQVSTKAGSGISWNGNSSIFASWIGINDINWCSKLFSPEPDVPFMTCLTPRMDEYFNLMGNLYTTGARNFFFVNMPPLQRAPMVTENGEEIVANYAEGVELFNNHLLPQYVSNFTSTHHGVKTIIYDAHTFFSNILDHPHWYGFKNNHCYSCIGCYNVTGCFWANNYHPVWQVHERLASDMSANLTSIGWPIPQPLFL